MGAQADRRNGQGAGGPRAASDGRPARAGREGRDGREGRSDPRDWAGLGGGRGRAPVDVAIIGAGIVGLAHAAEAVRRGLSVAVVERDEFARGASIRNFGHGCFTGQAGIAGDYARTARRRWVELGRAAGFWVGQVGTVVAARAEDELAVLTEFAAAAAAAGAGGGGGASASGGGGGGEDVGGAGGAGGDVASGGAGTGARAVADEERLATAVLLDADEVRARVPLRAPDLVGGAFLPSDVRVDPRTAVAALARWLADQGVTFHWRTSVGALSPGVVHTSRGDLPAHAIVLAAGHDLDRLFPTVAEQAGVRRCALHMLRVAAPAGTRFEPAVLTGLSLLRYSAFADCPSLPAVRARIGAARPELFDVDMNLMFTQLPSGDLLIGDTHAVAATHQPFRDAAIDDLVLAEVAGLLGVDALTVRERWRGYYAHASGREFLVATPLPGVRAVTVTTGIGMTTALGLAVEVLADLVR